MSQRGLIPNAKVRLAPGKSIVVKGVPLTNPADAVPCRLLLFGMLSPPESKTPRIPSRAETARAAHSHPRGRVVGYSLKSKCWQCEDAALPIGRACERHI